jgi:hypothetical protein
MRRDELFYLLQRHGFVPADATYAECDADEFRQLGELLDDVERELRVEFLTAFGVPR